jgi:hypothetical protein
MTGSAWATPAVRTAALSNPDDGEIAARRRDRYGGIGRGRQANGQDCANNNFKCHKVPSFLNVTLKRFCRDERRKLSLGEWNAKQVAGLFPALIAFD